MGRRGTQSRDAAAGAARARVAAALLEAREQLLRGARALAHDEDSAAELFQATALRALERASSLREPARPVAWMMRIMRNLHVDGRRRRVGALALVGELAAPGPEPLPRWRQVGDDEVAAWVSRFLSEELRLVWHFTQVEKLNQRAVAERLGISRVTVATRVLRVRARLRRALAPDELG